MDSNPKEKMLDLNELFQFSMPESCKEMKDHKPWASSGGRTGPKLRKNGLNRILIYPGGFNPPHKAHLALLEHTMKNAGDDWYMPAAIVVLLDDEIVARKVDDVEKPLRLTKEQRANIWRSSGIDNEKFWVFGGSRAEYHLYIENAKAKAKTAGIDLCFTELVGPDHIRRGTTAKADIWDCNSLITSDIARRSAFVVGESSVETLPQAHPWRHPQIRPERLQVIVHAKNRGRTNAEMQQALCDSQQNLGRIWDTSLTQHRGTKIRFIACGPDEVLDRDHSSTLLRQVASHCPESRIEAELEKHALSPKILFRYIQEHRQKHGIPSRGLELAEDGVQTPLDRLHRPHTVEYEW